MIASKGADVSVPFIIAVKDTAGTEVASGQFSFDASIEKMYLTVTTDNKILEDKDYER